MGIRDLLVNGPLGFGTAPLGNMFRDTPDDEAEATVDAAWEHGTRFSDTAPMYGAGLAEIRLGEYLAQHDRDDYVLSTKVGRLVLDEIDTDARCRGCPSRSDHRIADAAKSPIHDQTCA
jgi:D-threo-aldose 1-dehydrogenase